MEDENPSENPCWAICMNVRRLDDRQKPGLVDIKLDSQWKGSGFKSCLILPTLDGNGVKAMSGRLK